MLAWKTVVQKVENSVERKVVWLDVWMVDNLGAQLVDDSVGHWAEKKVALLTSEDHNDHPV
jgi:response regulator of citrate/malate metabolism